MAAIRRGILDVCGAADLAGVEVVLTPSGTDGEYVALHLARGGSRQPIVNIVIAPDETGSGVLAAAQGRHFARITPSGAAARPDAAIAGFDPDLIQVPTVPIRGSDGQPRAVAEIDAEVTALVEQALAAGRRCLVHVLAGSKTGLLAPSFAASQKLRRVQRRRGRRRGRCLSDAAIAGTHPRLPRGGLDGPRDRLEILRRSAVRRSTAAPRHHRRTRVRAEALAGGSGRLLQPGGVAAHLAAPDRPPAGASEFGLVLRWQAALWEMRGVPGRAPGAAYAEHDRARRGDRRGARRGALIYARSPSRPPASGPRRSFHSRCCGARPTAVRSRWTSRR